MRPEDKKKFILKALANPAEKRSYNEIKADLELQLWRERMQGGF